MNTESYDIGAITSRFNGYYSTILLSSGIVETCWFGDDGSSEVIGRKRRESLASIADMHIREFESGGN